MMNEVIRGLWLGDLPSAMDTQGLKANKIFSVLSVMRGRIAVHKTFIQHQVPIDDTEDEDILTHLLPSIHYVQAELDKGRNVLVHCQAGVSRSASIVAAYLMYSKKIDLEEALAIIRQVRPFVDPNSGFLQQLETFHKTNYIFSERERGIRRFYLTRAAEKMIAGGSVASPEMFANYPQTKDQPSPSISPAPRRYIRCKMCRRELATRDHMLDHGKTGHIPPAPSRELSKAHQQQKPGKFHAAVSSSNAGQGGPLDSESPSGVGMITPEAPVMDAARTGAEEPEQLPASTREGLEVGEPRDPGYELQSIRPLTNNGDDQGTANGNSQTLLEHRTFDVATAPTESSKDVSTHRDENARREPSIVDRTKAQARRTTHLVRPADLTAQLNANPRLAVLRSSSLGPSGDSPLQTPTISTESNRLANNPPIIFNPKCSGYFVEPIKWMEPFLQEGQLSGKIICPNRKCGAKLGNYDWAGVCCGCKEWVVPGFCINRSKVDEVVV